jgi:A/G-specific adenine glycosylase
MLQQTQVAAAIGYFERWMRRFPTLEALAGAAEQDVLREWQGLGYYSRARNLHKAAKEVLTRFGGIIPDDPAELRHLPGVGPYSAGAIASFAFDRPAAAVDANIARVLARLTNLQTAIDTPPGSRKIWEIAEAMLPAGSGGRSHTSALMELGALVCTPRQPQCLLCPIQALCRAESPESLPVKAPRRKTVALQEHAAWIVRDNLLLLEQQEGKRAGGLWKLPVLDSVPGEAPVLYETVYPFTHHKITLTVRESDAPACQPANQRWFPLETVLTDAPLTAGHRRAITALAAERPTNVR